MDVEKAGVLISEIQAHYTTTLVSAVAISAAVNFAIDVYATVTGQGGSLCSSASIQSSLICIFLVLIWFLFIHKKRIFRYLILGLLALMMVGCSNGDLPSDFKNEFLKKWNAPYQMIHHNKAGDTIKRVLDENSEELTDAITQRNNQINPSNPLLLTFPENITMSISSIKPPNFVIVGPNLFYSNNEATAPVGSLIIGSIFLKGYYRAQEEGTNQTEHQGTFTPSEGVGRLEFTCCDHLKLSSEIYFENDNPVAEKVEINDNGKTLLFEHGSAPDIPPASPGKGRYCEDQDCSEYDPSGPISQDLENQLTPLGKYASYYSSTLKEIFCGCKICCP